MKSSRRSPKLLFLLDYDGTLTDFKRNPGHSRLTPAAKNILRRIQRKYPVIFISGRYLDSLVQVSGLPRFPMVGTHGFEARNFAKGFRLATASQERRFKKEAGRLWDHLQALRGEFTEIHIEKKPFSSTLHYRGVAMAPARVKKLHRRFNEIFRKAVTRRLWSLMGGKQMIEALPKGFSKGKAVAKILGLYPGALPIYAGDDLTDLTVFKALGKKGMKVGVGGRIPKNMADLSFGSPKAFLAWLKIFTAF